MSDFNLMILASTPEDALSAQEAGVDRIFYDLEYIGKAERQRGRDTVKYHKIDRRTGQNMHYDRDGSSHGAH